MSMEVKERPKANLLAITCPYCAGANFVRRGTRRKKREIVQLYLCRDCRRSFTPGAVKGRHYGLATILDAMSLYYLGYSLDKAREIAGRINRDNRGEGTAEKTAAKIGSGTLLNWLNQYHSLCAFSRMREFAIKMFPPEEMIASATLAHRQLYRFRYHRAKTPLIIREDIKHARFWPLKEFLELVPAECPHQYFQEGARASEAPIAFSKTQMIVRAKHNYACELAGFALGAAGAAKDRHDLLQRFMLANDSVTVATEVPVYIRKEDLTHMRTQLGFQLYKKVKTPHTPLSEGGQTGSSPPPKGGEGGLTEMPDEEIPKLITGHIDFLQIRNGYIHILDYKPHAARDRPLEQLTLYALALSRLTGLRVFNFKCAWFDEKDYFEFFPLHLVHKPGKRRRRIKTIEGVYDINDNPRRLEKLRPP